MKRIVFLDNARTIALFLVVFAHLYSTNSDVKLYIYAFHMPFFFFISGYLYKESSSKSLFLKLLKKLIIPFIFYFIIGYIFWFFFSYSTRFEILKISIAGILFGVLIKANSILWFLIALFNVRIMGNFYIKKPLLFTILCIAVFIPLAITNTNYLFIRTSLMALPFYLFGHYGKKITNFLLHSKYVFIYASLLLIISIVISNQNGKVSVMGVSFGNYDLIWLRVVFFYINGIVGSVMLLSFAILFQKESKIVYLISKSSISIVGLQSIPIILWSKYVGSDQNYIISVLFSCFILTNCVLFHLIIEKKAIWLLGGK